MAGERRRLARPPGSIIATGAPVGSHDIARVESKPRCNARAWWLPDDTLPNDSTLEGDGTQALGRNQAHLVHELAVAKRAGVELRHDVLNIPIESGAIEEHDAELRALVKTGMILERSGVWLWRVHITTFSPMAVSHSSAMSPNTSVSGSR